MLFGRLNYADLTLFVIVLHTLENKLNKINLNGYISCKIDQVQSVPKVTLFEKILIYTCF